MSYAGDSQNRKRSQSATTVNASQKRHRFDPRFPRPNMSETHASTSQPDSPSTSRGLESQVQPKLDAMLFWIKTEFQTNQQIIFEQLLRGLKCKHLSGGNLVYLGFNSIKAQRDAANTLRDSGFKAHLLKAIKRNDIRANPSVNRQKRVIRSKKSCQGLSFMPSMPEKASETSPPPSGATFEAPTSLPSLPDPSTFPLLRPPIGLSLLPSISLFSSFPPQLPVLQPTFQAETSETASPMTFPTSEIVSESSIGSEPMPPPSLPVKKRPSLPLQGTFNNPSSLPFSPQ